MWVSSKECEKLRIIQVVCGDFPGGPVVKNSPCNAREEGLILSLISAPDLRTSVYAIR